MYTSLFKLKELPFRLSPDPAFLFLSAHHARAKAYMESTIWFQDGFVIITGEIGAGKTTLIETFLQELDQEVIVAQINQTQVSPTEFLQAVLVQFGYTPFNMKKAELIATLNNFLIEQYASGRKVLLIVDEAQNLSLRVLEEVRMLSGVETTKEKVLRIILAGQPELNAKLDSPELIQLSQRVRLRFHLTPLSEEDTRAYVLHRLEIAGAAGRTIFADSCFPLLFRYTGGVPRLVNTLCETAMMAAFGEDRDRITPGDLRKAIAELRWVDYATRTATQRSMIEGHAPTTADIAATGSRQGPGLYVPAGDDDEILARLVVARDDEIVGELPLRMGRTVVGRTSDNDLQIDSRLVSRHHCQIVTSRDQSVVEDLNSTNGIAVRGKRVRRMALRNGDVIVIGRHELRYVDVRKRGSDIGVDTLAPLPEHTMDGNEDGDLGTALQA